MSAFVQQRQLFLRQLAQACPDSSPALKAYLSSTSDLISPSYKKTRDPLAMKELTSKCPSCSQPYSSQSFHYHGKFPVNRRLHCLLAIRRKYKRIPTPNTYKRRLFDHFTLKSRSKLSVKCSSCGERRSFQGATRQDLPNRIIARTELIKPRIAPSNHLKLKQTFEKVSCRFLKKESNLRAFLEQL